MTELTDNDRQRIEQAARSRYSANHHYPMQQEAFKNGAEYATKYEREQQAELKAEYHALCERTREPLAREEDLHKYRNALQMCHDREKKLEAERSELIGKLQARLERCRKVSGYSSGFSDIHNEIDFLDLLLNSLKTK